VTVVVGSGADKKEFYIHAGLLTHCSSYFRNALKPEWAEGRARKIVLSEDIPVIFRIFFHWAYSDKLYPPLANGRIPISYNNICALYVFAGTRGIPELCNAAVNVLFQKFACAWGFPTNCLTFVYDNTLVSSKLHDLLIDLAVCCFSFCNLGDEEELFPKEFLVDVILRSRKLKIWPGNCKDKDTFLTTKASEMCMYHDHQRPSS
jgi:hypothetical protein